MRRNGSAREQGSFLPARLRYMTRPPAGCGTPPASLRRGEAWQGRTVRTPGRRAQPAGRQRSQPSSSQMQEMPLDAYSFPFLAACRPPYPKPRYTGRLSPNFYSRNRANAMPDQKDDCFGYVTIAVGFYALLEG